MVTHGKGGVYLSESHKEISSMIELLYVLFGCGIMSVYGLCKKSYSCTNKIFVDYCI